MLVKWKPKACGSGLVACSMLLGKLAFIITSTVLMRSHNRGHRRRARRGWMFLVRSSGLEKELLAMAATSTRNSVAMDNHDELGRSRTQFT